MERKIKKGNHTTKKEYESSIGLRIICFLIPLVGLIIYSVNIVQKPKIARECGKFALFGFVLSIIVMILIFIIVINEYSNSNTGLITPAIGEEQTKYQEETDEVEKEFEKIVNDVLANY